jgi:hypothetical protein
MTLKHGDLIGMIFNDVSIDEFKPKAGKVEDVIVVAFCLKDKSPAEDLNTFIQRSFIETLDSDVSNGTDQEGHYLLFVEFDRNDKFFKNFQALLKDIQNLTGRVQWKVRTYLSDGLEFDYTDPKLEKYVVLDPKEYITKDKYKMANIKEDIEFFFQDTYISDLTIQENTITISDNRRTIRADVVDTGDYDMVIDRNLLKESAFRLTNKTQEQQILENILGNCSVFPIENYLCVGRGDRIILLKNTEIVYKGR